jgi:hypothetical protein
LDAFSITDDAIVLLLSLSYTVFADVLFRFVFVGSPENPV